MLSAVGGLFAGLKAGMLVFVSMVAGASITTQFANRLYTWIKPDSFSKPQVDELGKPLTDKEGNVILKKSILEESIP